MAVSSDQINGLIDANLPDATDRRNKAGVVRTLLKLLTNWVRDAINANLTTWLRISDGQPGGANTDSVYRTGSAEFRGGGVFLTRTPTNAELKLVPPGNYEAIQIRSINGGPAFMEFHLPGLLLHQLGVDTDGLLKFRQWATNVSSPLVIDGVTRGFALTEELGNRKVVFYGNINDHQYFGFGLNASVLRYQIGGIGAAHIFYAGSSPATSEELLRIQGDGKVGIGTNAPTSTLDLAGAGHQQFRLRNGFTPANSGDGNGQQGQVAWDTNYFYLKTPAGWKRAALTSW